MSYSEQLNDILLMQKHLENIDTLTKYEIYLQDVLSHHDEMIAKEEKYANEYLLFLNPFKRISFWKAVFSIFYIGLLVAITILLSVDNPYRTIIKNTVKNFFEDTKNPLAIIFVVPIQIACLALLYFLFKSIKNVFRLIMLPSQSIKYNKEKRQVKKYLKDTIESLNIDIAKDTIYKINVLIANDLEQVNHLFDKYDINMRLRNRENVATIIKLLQTNKKINLTIQEVAKYILENNCIKETLDVDKYALALLLCDPNFTWYAKENPWFKRLKKKEKKEHVNIIGTIFQLYGKAFQIFTGGVDKEAIKNHTIASSNNGVSRPIKSVDFTPEKKGNCVFRDSKGCLVESNGLFHDGKGNLCEQGGLFYDAKGNLCDSKSPYYDSKGNLCEPGSAFCDAYGNMIDPRG